MPHSLLSCEWRAPIKPKAVHYAVRGYLERWRRHGAPRAPGYWRMRIALYAGLTTVGAVLGMAVGAWIRR